MMMIRFEVELIVSLGFCVLFVVMHGVVTGVFVGFIVRGFFVFVVRVKRLGWVSGFGYFVRV